jgi:hypothetical protein
MLKQVTALEDFVMSIMLLKTLPAVKLMWFSLRAADLFKGQAHVSQNRCNDRPISRM